MSASLINANRMRIVKIERVVDESSRAKSFYFRDELCSRAEAGQFIMVWIPGVDEIPLSLSSIQPEKSLSSVTVAEVGEATKALNRKREGDMIGVRGPFGNSFKIIRGRVLIVGGGVGLAPLMPLIERLAGMQDASVTVLAGARTKHELIFLDRLEDEAGKGRIELTVLTEDGSYGGRGLVTDPLENLLSSDRIDMIYGCGPEKMISRLYSVAERFNVPLQICVERIIKCSIGICGSCAIGRYRVCRDGPIFTSDRLREVEDELGKFKRGFDGHPIPIT